MDAAGLITVTCPLSTIIPYRIFSAPVETVEFAFKSIMDYLHRAALLKNRPCMWFLINKVASASLDPRRVKNVSLVYRDGKLS